MANKQNSNSVECRYAEETTPGVVASDAIWYPLEPNSYKDMGATTTLMARKPINASRQRQKGVITDLEAAGGIEQDLTQNGLTRLMQGFLFCSIREKLTNLQMNGTKFAAWSVVGSTKTYRFSTSTAPDPVNPLASLVAGDLVLFEGYSQAANNGLKTIVSTTVGTDTDAGLQLVVVAETCSDETITDATSIGGRLVGHQFGAGELGYSTSGSYPRLTRASGAFDLSAQGFVVGEWVFIGGDAAGKKFATVGNNGFARIRAIAASYLEFDKVSGTAATEAAGSLTVQVFYGNVMKNEKDPANIVARSYQMERTLGEDSHGTQSEYVIGAFPNELTVNVKQADKVTVEMGFVAMDAEQRTGTTEVKTGTRPTLVSGTAFNTSSDVSRLKMHIVTAGTVNPTPLFAYLTDLSLSVKNNCKTQKAIAVLGAFDVSAGTFEVSSSVKAYFADIASVAAVRNNNDVALDFALVKNHAGFLFDLPLVALGDGKLEVTLDEAITLPLTVEAAEGSAGHTLLINEFPYLPTLADS